MLEAKKPVQKLYTEVKSFTSYHRKLFSRLSDEKFTLTLASRLTLLAKFRQSNPHNDFGALTHNESTLE